MKVYYNHRLLVVETNRAWALPYWTLRRQANSKIRWVFT